MSKDKRIAIVGVGYIEPMSTSMELAKAALQYEGIVIVSANDIDSQDMKVKLIEEAKYLPKDEVYKLHALPLIDEPYIATHKDNKPFYYNVPRKKRRK